MAIALLGQASGTITNETTATIVPSPAYTTGSTLILLVPYYTPTLASVAVSGGGVTTWVKDVENLVDTAWGVSIWRGLVTGASANVVVVAGANSYGQPTVLEISADLELETSNNANAVNSINSSGSITPAASTARLLVGVASFQDSATGAPAGWTQLTANTVTTARGAVYRIESSTSGSYSVAWTGTGSTHWVNAIASYQEAAGVTPLNLGTGTARATPARDVLNSITLSYGQGPDRTTMARAWGNLTITAGGPSGNLGGGTARATMARAWGHLSIRSNTDVPARGTVAFVTGPTYGCPV